ncbi:ankyrin repeat domain-containing protein [Flaviramulus aquimarinus]|uniref:ankyrin repeat domain-containing protein n=1 Tax=Flaviramulus aquimarinus TaxID=1170456 RepID=UPI003CD06403
MEHSDKPLLESLIKSRIDLNITDEFVQTPLHLAIDTAFEEAIYVFDTENKFIQPRMDIIRILLKNGANHLKEDNR